MNRRRTGTTVIITALTVLGGIVTAAIPPLLTHCETMRAIEMCAAQGRVWYDGECEVYGPEEEGSR